MLGDASRDRREKRKNCIYCSIKNPLLQNEKTGNIETSGHKIFALLQLYFFREPWEWGKEGTIIDEHRRMIVELIVT